MSDVTVVCCYNNKKQYEEFAASLKAQTCPFELIGIDNTGNNSFTSCASAYNSVIDRVRTKYIIYSHQDILFPEPDVLEKFTAYLGRLGADDLLGVAGVRFDTERGISNIQHRQNTTGRLVRVGKNPPDFGIAECDTFDECFFGGYTEHFKAFPFDEVICDNWHLYAVEECLRTKARGRVYVCDARLIHLSSGNYNPALVSGFFKLCRKYAGDFPFIRTTCLASQTKFIPLALYCWPRWLKSYAGVILRRIGLYDTVKKLLP